MNIKQNILLTCVIGSLSMGAFAQKGGTDVKKGGIDVKKKSCEDITTLDVAATLSLGFTYRGKIEDLENDVEVLKDKVHKFGVKVHSIENLMTNLYPRAFEQFYTDAIAINRAVNLNGNIDSELVKKVDPDRVKLLNEEFLRTKYGNLYIYGDSEFKLIDCEL
jgi:hypothetical protein